MSIPTKLFIPPLRDNVIARSRLTDRVLDSLHGKLTLVSAPAGFGKTTLLCECTRHFDRPAAWVSLDKGDNDKKRFLTYFVSGVGVVAEGFGESILNTLQLDHVPNDDILLAGLINEIVEIRMPFVIILDDYHVIENQEIHEFLAKILENQPVEMHLIISTRSDPPWPLARWRVRQEMMEIRSQDLRFSLDETRTFLQDIKQLNLSEDAVSKLEARTEGWAAGLLLAAVSLQGRKDADRFIQAFEGSHRFIFDYLIEEVLDQLPAETKAFLIRTAILDKLCAPLCNALLDIQDSQDVLHKLDSMNLFIVPLDDKRTWYRYHNLFFDLLSSRQVELEASEHADLHARASQWYEQNGYLLDAIDHAVRGGSVDRAAQLIEANVLGIIDRGELGVLIQLLNQLPDKTLAMYPWLQIALAWALTQTGSFDAALAHLRSVQDRLEDQPEAQVRHILGHSAAMQSYIELLTIGNYDQGITLAKKALKLLPASDLRARGMVYVTLGTMQRTHQEPAASLETLNSALEIYRTRNQPYVIIDILAQMARAYRELGLLHETVRFCEKALEIADQYSRGKFGQFPNTAYTMGILGRIYYEWNQLDKAVEIGLEGLAISERWGQANTLLGMYLLLARIFRVQGNFQEALDAIRAARSVGGRISDMHEFVIRTHEVHIRLAMGDLGAVADWVETGSREMKIAQDGRLWELAPLIVGLNSDAQEGALNELLESLDRLSSVSKESEIQRQSIKVDIQKAVIYDLQKKSNQSLAAMERALSIGKDEGYVRSFIDQGQPMENILKRVIVAGLEVDYASELLSSLQADLDRQRIQPVIRGTAGLIEPLTPRETEVLRLLSTDLSIPEIAEELVVAIGTLRTHIKRIYNKLDAHSRFEAVSKARELNRSE